MRLLDICEISRQKVNQFDSEKKYIATGDVNNNEITSYTNVTFEDRPSRANQIAIKDEILIAKMQNTIKVLKIDNNTQNNIYSTGFFIIKAKKGVVPDYLYWLFNSKKFNYQKDKNCKGATQKAINNIGLSKINVKDIPNTDEQNKIVNRLNTIHSVINMKKIQLKKLDELIKSQFVEMFGNVHLNDKRWKEYKKLGEVCELNPKKSEISNIDDSTEVSFIPMQSVSENGNINSSETRKIFQVKNGFTYFKNGDVLFAKITPCMENGKGAVAIGLKNNIRIWINRISCAKTKEKCYKF